MYRAPHLTAARPRRGIILLIVLTMLSLFAVIGISFVLLTSSEADLARTTNDAGVQDPNRSGIVGDYLDDGQIPYPQGLSSDPNLLFSAVLSELVWGVGDNADGTMPGGIRSALRAHELSRTLDGFYYAGQPFDPYNPTANGANVFPTTTTVANATPFNGTGRLHTGPVDGIYAPGAINWAGEIPQFNDDYYLIQYIYFQQDGFIRDPERGGSATLAARDKNGTQAPYTGGFNAPYTYPDLNNMALAAVKADGTVLCPSLHRPWLFGSLDSSNPNWTNKAGKYLLLRYRPIDMGPGFPYPEDLGGDVKNLTFSPGYYYYDPNTQKSYYYNNDSVWVDAGLPVMVTKSGKKYKPLVAILAMDLDNRPNANVHGNMRGIVNNQYVHASHEGWGKSEVNLSRVLVQGSGTEWLNLFVGNQNLPGRYGQVTQQNPVPQPCAISGGVLAPGTADFSLFYAQGDPDAVQEGTSGQPPSYQPSAAMQLPAVAGGTNPNPPHYPFPYYPGASYGNGDQFERKFHPALFNFWAPSPGQLNQQGQVIPETANHVFPASEMEALLRFGTPGANRNSQLLALLPNNLNNAADSAGSYKRRHLLTTHSFDLERPALAPWIYTPATADAGAGGAGAYTLGAFVITPGTPTRPAAAPQGTAVNFQAPAAAVRTPAGTPQANYGEFNQVDWRTIEAALCKVDVNRPLAAYPAADPATGRINMAGTTNGQANTTVFLTAQTARQQLAQDIFDRLMWVTTGYNPVDWKASPRPSTLPPAGSTRYNALRWLAQLAVNIVDYVDADDIITPFQWDPTQGAAGYVFGTELPRLVINEAYSELANDPADPGPRRTGNLKMATIPYRANFWVELMNPFQNNTTTNITNNNQNTNQDAGVARLQVAAAGASPAYAVYQVVIATSPELNLRSPDNVRGKPDAQTSKKLVVQQYVPETGTTPTVDPTVVLPNGGQYAGANGGNVGFYVLGPKYDFPQAIPGGVANTDPTLPVATLRVKENMGGAALPDPDDGQTYTNAMSYALATTDPSVLATPPKHTILLRRLACPGLPPQNNPNPPAGDPNPVYNPYITVDYMDNVVPNVGVSVGPLPGGAAPAQFVAPAARVSYGKQHPYAGDSSFDVPGGVNSMIKPQAPNPAYITMPQNTFFRQNADASLTALGPNVTSAPANYPAFDWLVHLDRAVVSPVELLHVSAYKPHELTQQFQINNSGTVAKFQHTANWFDESNRLYRAFEFFEAHDRMGGGVQGGRVPGKINLNTIWDFETFLALCDPQGANNFNQGQVQQMYNALISQRSPGTGTGQLTQNDRPFLGMAPGRSPGGGATVDPLYPNGSGVKDTIFRAADGTGNAWVNPASPTLPATRLLEPSDPTNAAYPAGVHPFMRYQLMSKIFNNTTTRSNVFAVWMTVGYFEVTQDTDPTSGQPIYPVKLGAEIGKSQGRNIRHRMFAVVDRSALTIDLTQTPQGNYYRSPGLRPVLLTAHGGVPQPGASGANATLQLEVLSGSYEGTSWSVQVGTPVLVDIGGKEELVTVSAVSQGNPNANPPVMPSFTAGPFYQAHTDPVTITLAGGDPTKACKLGSPGPQPLFDQPGKQAPKPWNYPVVPYYRLIE